MANPETLATLRARALDYADMTSSSFPVEARINDYINDGLSALHDLLVGAFEDYLIKSTTVSVSAGTESYSLPADFYKMRKVFYKSANRRYPVRRYSPQELEGYKESPISSGTFEIWYVPQFEKLSTDSDAVNVSVPIRWENYVALHAAVQLLNREESDSSWVANERQREEQRILRMAEDRDIGAEERVVDVYGRFNTASAFLAADEKSFMYRIMGDKIYFTQNELAGV